MPTSEKPVWQLMLEAQQRLRAAEQVDGGRRPPGNPRPVPPGTPRR